MQKCPVNICSLAYRHAFCSPLPHCLNHWWFSNFLRAWYFLVWFPRETVQTLYSHFQMECSDDFPETTAGQWMWKYATTNCRNHRRRTLYLFTNHEAENDVPSKSQIQYIWLLCPKKRSFRFRTKKERKCFFRISFSPLFYTIHQHDCHVEMLPLNFKYSDLFAELTEGWSGAASHNHSYPDYAKYRL